jgi:putative Ca2+/H+ antiporter (TMEM165/GDT1 family)
MIEHKEINPFYFTAISFFLTIISKISDNSFISLIYLKQNTSSIILYLSSILSSLLLNIGSIIIGNLILIFMNIDIIKNFFLIIVFSLYGFMSLIVSLQIITKKDNNTDKLIEKILNKSSDEDSERPNFHIKEIDNNEMEIELDNLNNNDDSFEKNIDLDKSNNKKDKDNNLNSNLNSFFNAFHSLILMEIGDKIQIMNISLEAKFEKWFYLILGNFFGNLLINYISIVYGTKIIEKKINYIFIFLESIIYFIIAFYYIYLSF